MNPAHASPSTGLTSPLPVVTEAVAGPFVERLAKAYASIPIGDPLEPGTLIGPLIDHDAVEGYERAIATAKAQGGEVLVGGRSAGVRDGAVDLCPHQVVVG